MPSLVVVRLNCNAACSSYQRSTSSVIGSESGYLVPTSDATRSASNSKSTSSFVTLASPSLSLRKGLFKRTFSELCRGTVAVLTWEPVQPRI
jgi:hypothetical protein